MSEDNFETLFQTYTRDKIDEIVGEIRGKATSNDESIRALQTQSDENLKKVASLQSQATENKEGIQALQNRLSENRTQVNNLIESAKGELEKKNSDLVGRVELLEKKPVPSSGGESGPKLIQQLDWYKKLYTYNSGYDYLITIYHIVGPIYFVYVVLSPSAFRAAPTNSPSTTNLITPQEITDLHLYFAPQKLVSTAGSNTPYISSVLSDVNYFLVDEMGEKTSRQGKAGFFAISTMTGGAPDFVVDDL